MLINHKSVVKVKTKSKSGHYSHHLLRKWAEHFKILISIFNLNFNCYFNILNLRNYNCTQFYEQSGPKFSLSAAEIVQMKGFLIYSDIP